MTGTQPSPATVSRGFYALEAEYNTWKDRRLATYYLYVFADGAYFSVIYDEEGCKMPIMAIVSITATGEREVLAFSLGDRENQSAWEALFEVLKRRGLQEVGLWVTDGHQAMLNALAAKFGDTPRQRCVKHKLDNVLGYIPAKQRDQVEPELKAIFYDEDQCLIGHIAGINDVVGFHSDSVAELRTAFEEAVEDYLETCEKLGRAPQKPYSGKLMLRVPPEVHAAVAAAAEARPLGNADQRMRKNKGNE